MTATNYEFYPRTISTDQQSSNPDAPSGALPSTLGVPGLQYILPVAQAAGAGGASDVQVTIPFKAQLYQTTMSVTNTGAGGGNMTVRTAAAGGGSAASSALSTGSTGYVSGNFTSAPVTFAAGATAYLRLSDNTAVGTIYLHLIALQ